MSEAPVETETITRRPGLRSRLVTGLKYLFGVVAIVLLVVGIVSQRHEIASALRRLDPATIVLACVFTLVALVVNMLSWKSVISSLHTPVTLKAAASIFFVGQLGKYIPGGVWAIAAQAELGKSFGLKRGASAFAAITSMLVGMVSAAVVGVVGLLFSSPDALQIYWWLAIVALLGLVALTPPVLSRLVTLALRLLRRSDSEVRLTWPGILSAFGWSVLMWLAYAVQATLVLHAFGSTGSHLYVITMGAYAIAWLVGFLVVIAPAGLGAREGVLLLLLAGVTTQGGALGLAVLSRGMMTLGDVVLASVGAVLAARRRRHISGRNS